MGNYGATVYNATQYPINVFLSMGAAHYYCNGIQPNEAFTIYPGAVWYTFNAYLDTEDNRMDDSRVWKQVALIALPIVAGTGNAVFRATFKTGPADSQPVSTSIQGAKTKAIEQMASQVLEIGQELSSWADKASVSPQTDQIIKQAAVGAQEGVIFAFNLQRSLQEKLGEDFDIKCIPQKKDCCKILGYDEDVTTRLREEFENIAKQCNLITKIQGIYCSLQHTTLKVIGGPYVENGQWKKEDFAITECRSSEIPKSIKFRKKGGYQNHEFKYWTKIEGKKYPPNNF